jgi:hypothetical protein
MKKRILQVFLIFILLSIGTAVVFSHLLAQSNPPALILHPSNFDLTLIPGISTTQTLYLKNTTQGTLTIQTHIRNFTAQGEEGGVDITSDTTPYSLASWTSITPEKIDVPAGKEVKFVYTITPPRNAEPGGHFGSIVFATIPSSVNQQTGSAVSQEIAALILAKIPGDAKEGAIVESLSTDKSFYEFGPVDFSLRVKNTGDIHIVPAGTLVIKGTFGDRYLIPLEPRNILPNSVRKIPVQLKHSLLIGQYSATLIATYGTKNQQLSAYTTFTAFPLRYGLLVLVVLALLFILRKRLLKATKALILGK